MRSFFNFVIYFWSINLTLSLRNTYKVGVINVPGKEPSINLVVPLIHEAARSKVDIILIPSQGASTPLQIDNYDEVINAISVAAKETGTYLVTHLYEPVRCQNKEELFRSNLVFDREGSIISASRKNGFGVTTKCNTTAPETGRFISDFGVEFNVLMEEDIVMRNLKSLKDVKNFIVTGAWSSEIPFLNANQFSSSWSFANNANLISNSGVYAGRAGRIDKGSDLEVVELSKYGGPENLMIPPVTGSVSMQTLPSVDFSHNVVRPLDLEASANGHNETVCYEEFCCEFYVKTKPSESKATQAKYGLAVFSGVRHFAQNHHIGTQNCAIISAGLFKKTCVGCENNNSSTTFETIVISGNFVTPNSAQYPMMSTMEPSTLSKQFRFYNDGNDKVIIEIDNANVVNFGIFGRDFSKDFAVEDNKSDAYNLDTRIYDYIFNDDVQEFCEYIWIRLRVLIFVVSIYVLEMM